MTAGRGVLTRVTDHSENRWSVNGGDPAMTLVNRLKRNNYDFVVLPARMLATGVDDGETPEVPDIINRVRMLDCLALLRKGA